MGAVLALCLCSCGVYEKYINLSTEVHSLIQEKDELSAKVVSLTLDNATIQKSYDDLLAEVLTDKRKIQHIRNAAGIALGCDWLVPLCPYSLVALGRQAIDEGYTPDPFLYYLSGFAKFAALSLLVSIFICALKFFHILLVMPASLVLIEAKEIIENAQNFMLNEKDQLKAQIDELKTDVQEEMELTNELNNENFDLLNIQTRIEKEIKQLKVMKDLLITSLIV